MQTSTVGRDVKTPATVLQNCAHHYLLLKYSRDTCCAGMSLSVLFWGEGGRVATLVRPFYLYN